MTEDRAGAVPAQPKKRRRFRLALAVAILLATPLLVVGSFHVVSRERFANLEAEHGAASWPRSRYDAFKHAYSSGVVAVVLGEDVAAFSGDLVELYEQEPCLERAKDQFNNRAGRRLAIMIHEEDPADWRRRLAEAIYDDLLARDSGFSVIRDRDSRILEICASD